MHNIGRRKIGLALILLTLAFAFSGCGMMGRAGQWLKSKQTELSPNDTLEQTVQMTESIETTSPNNEPFGRAEQLTELMETESTKINAMSLEIIRCFKDNDQEGLKSLFCEKSRSAPDFDAQITQAFEYVKGDVLDYDINDSAGGGQSIDNGKITEWDVSPEIKYVKTFEDISPAETEDGLDFVTRVYDINYYWVITNEEDKSLEGLQYMTIEFLNVDKITIGEYFD